MTWIFETIWTLIGFIPGIVAFLAFFAALSWISGTWHDDGSDYRP